MAIDTYIWNVIDSRGRHIKGDFLWLNKLFECCVQIVAYEVYEYVAMIELHLCIENSKKMEFFWVFVLGSQIHGLAESSFSWGSRFPHLSWAG